MTGNRAGRMPALQGTNSKIAKGAQVLRGSGQAGATRDESRAETCRSEDGGTKDEKAKAPAGGQRYKKQKATAPAGGQRYKKQKSKTPAGGQRYKKQGDVQER